LGASKRYENGEKQLKRHIIIASIMTSYEKGHQIFWLSVNFKITAFALKVRTKNSLHFAEME
jgi:hypothetical protein